MKKSTGKFSSIFTTVISISLLLASLVLFAGAYKERNTAKAEQYMSEGNTAEALIHFKKAERFAIHPDEKILKGIIECSIKEDDLETAEATTEKLLKIDPDNVQMRFTLGKIQIRNNDFDSAKEQIHKLREMRTEETQRYADDLTSQIRAATVKDIIENIIDKVAPMFDLSSGAKPKTSSDDVLSGDSVK
ncbi:MAG: tetratricopeptide repeat protein [Synergistaceae bacterium]